MEKYIASDAVRGSINAINIWIECVLQTMPRDQQKQVLIALQKRTPEVLKTLQIVEAPEAEVTATRDALERQMNATSRIFQESMFRTPPDGD